MTQIATMSESEFDDRFLITGPRAIAFTLAALAREATPFSVHFGGELFVTRLLDASPEDGCLYFDYSGVERLNKCLLGEGRCSFAGSPDGIQVQFAVDRVSETVFQGGRAFSAPLPARILRLQRRESFRIATPRGRPFPFFGRLAEGALWESSVHDLSVAGIGLQVGSLPDALAVGERLWRCHFHLAEEAHELYCNATIRHLTEQEARAGNRLWRVGLAFEDLPMNDQNRIQRYIAHVERERKEMGV